ncbi:MAG: hypothetical protein ABJ246_01660 [Paracoccaceae bacterium]
MAAFNLCGAAKVRYETLFTPQDSGQFPAFCEPSLQGQAFSFVSTGSAMPNGVLRHGFTHYTSKDEIDHLLNARDAVL